MRPASPIRVPHPQLRLVPAVPTLKDTTGAGVTFRPPIVEPLTSFCCRIEIVLIGTLIHLNTNWRFFGLFPIFPGASDQGRYRPPGALLGEPEFWVDYPVKTLIIF